MTPPRDLHEELRRGVEEDGWHYSKLGLFMRDHPEKIAEVLAAAKGDWNWIARALAMADLTDHAHETPTAETARETWKRVEARRWAGMELRQGKR